MTKTLLLMTALALGASASARTLDEIKKDGTMIIATEGAFKPFNYFEGNKLTGFEVDLGNAIAKQLGFKTKWVTQPFDSLLIGLDQNRYDFVIASHGITPEREKAVDFTSPHYCTGGVVVAKPGGAKTAADLKGKTVLVQVGTTYLDNVKKVPGVGDVKTYPKDTDAIQALLSNRGDAWVSDKFVVLDALKANPGKFQQGDFLFQEKIGMAVKKGDTSLKAALNDALAALEKDGTYAKISDQYFGQDVRCK